MAEETNQTTHNDAETAGQQPAKVAAADKVNTSGAAQQIVPDVDMSHPAVDDNPRAKTTVMQNKIDFNDPTIPGHEAVARSLNEQGVATKGGAVAAKANRKAARQAG